MTPKKRKDSCTFKRENTLVNRERIYALVDGSHDTLLVSWVSPVTNPRHQEHAVALRAA